MTILATAHALYTDTSGSHAIDDLADHATRCGKLAGEFARTLRWQAPYADELAHAARIHDIGKSVLPIDILSKRGALSSDEWAIIRQHPVIGATMAHTIGEPLPIMQAIRHHHERFDGSGYPDRIDSATIPIMSRVIAIVDAFDAMTNMRSYRAIATPHEALSVIQHGAGTQFDPDLVPIFLGMVLQRRGFR